MFLGAYRFAGDPAQLLPAYDRLISALGPAALELHVCAAAPGGLVVLDTCPDEEVFAAFSTSAEFGAACRRAGLPEPTVELLGTVHHAVVAEAVRS